MEFYEESVVSLDMQWAIENEYGVPPICRIARVQTMDLSGINIVGGDFNQSKLQTELNKEANLHAIAMITEQERSGQTVVFTPSVFSAKGVCQYLNQNYGVPAVYVYGTMDEDERKEALRKFKACEVQVLVNCQVVAVGFDYPPTATLILGRPTRSRSFWLQCVGRATRNLPGVVDGRPWTGVSGTMGILARRTARLQSAKTHFKIVDCTNSSIDHKLITSVDMFAATSDEDVKAALKSAAAEKPLTPEEMAELARKEAEKKANAELIEAMRKNTAGRAHGGIAKHDIDLTFSGRRSPGTYMNPLRGKYAGQRLCDLPGSYLHWGSTNPTLTGWIRGMFRKEMDRRNGKRSERSVG
jgi:superfamily II DNA or RNA helicase